MPPTIPRPLTVAAELTRSWFELSHAVSVAAMLSWATNVDEAVDEWMTFVTLGRHGLEATATPKEQP